MSGVRAGLRSLPTSAKIPSGADAPECWLGVLGEAIIREATSTRGRAPAQLASEYRSSDVLEGEWSVSLGTTRLLRRKRQCDTRLRRIVALGRELGLEPMEHESDAVSFEIQCENDKDVRVFVSIDPSFQNGADAIRLWSCAIDVSPSAQSRSKAWPTPALKKLSKDLLINFLERNFNQSSTLVYAISRAERALIVFDEIDLSTIDGPALRRRATGVATAAASCAE